MTTGIELIERQWEIATLQTAIQDQGFIVLVYLNVVPVGKPVFTKDTGRAFLPISGLLGENHEERTKLFNAICMQEEWAEELIYGGIDVVRTGTQVTIDRESLEIVSMQAYSN